MSDFAQIYLEAWGAYESYRRLGFADDDVQFVYGPAINPVTGEEGEMLQVNLVCQDKSFVYVVGTLVDGFEKAQGIIQELKRQISSREISDDRLERMWRSTQLGSSPARFALLATLVKDKGFILPAVTN